MLADRVARLYAPVVHGLALATFLGWTLLGGLGWQTALLYAVAVLIITCPCALGLAVPAVQVIASGRLLRRGVLLKSATALERLAEVDTVVLDKTGTLTLGRPRAAAGSARPRRARRGRRIAGASRHPLARALCARSARAIAVPDGVEELPGAGLRRHLAEVRLGSRAFCSIPEDASCRAAPSSGWPGPAVPPVRFAFTDQLRADAAAVVAGSRAPRPRARAAVGRPRRRSSRTSPYAAASTAWRAGCTPADKVARLEELAAAGRRVLMVGDGLNDAPALAAAHVSLSPSTAIDISQNAADAVFQGELLAPRGRDARRRPPRRAPDPPEPRAGTRLQPARGAARGGSAS